jgi:RND family efflux transporter MFP subunit
MVEQTLAGVGDQVNKGQPLARLLSPALAEAQRGLLQASTQARLARENLTRDEQLWKDGIISESRYRAALSHHTEAAAALAERRQMLRLSGMSDESVAKLESGNSLNSLLIVTSPISGVILEKSINAGQRLEAATPMFKVAKLQPLGLEIQAPLANAHSIKVGAEVSIPSANARGKITAVGQSLSNSNQTVLIRALIHQGAQDLRPGQFVEASIVTASKGSAQWSVPNSALIRLEGKTLVFVETGNGFRPVPVATQQEGNQTTLVSGSLNSNDKIAVTGVSALKARLMGIGGGE